MALEHIGDTITRIVERNRPHTWTVLEHEDTRPDNLRLAVCAVCHEERLAAPETLRTAGGA